MKEPCVQISAVSVYGISAMCKKVVLVKKERCIEEKGTEYAHAEIVGV